LKKQKNSDLEQEVRKLIEIQEKYQVIKPKMNVLDIAAAP